MPSTSETGHAKNVANLADIISFCTSYGATYDPSRAALRLGDLATLQATAQLAINDVNLKNTTYNIAVNDRMLAFKPLRPLATRIINALSASDATDEVVKDAKSINRKLQGQRAKAIEQPTDPNTPAPKTISTSQQSYDQQLEHFHRLILLLQSEASYQPNETDLQVGALETLRNNLIAKNNAVASTYADVSNARIARNQVLYKPKTGLFDIALDVKQYIKSIFGSSSPQYKQISGIKFTTPKS